MSGAEASLAACVPPGSASGLTAINASTTVAASAQRAFMNSRNSSGVISIMKILVENFTGAVDITVRLLQAALDEPDKCRVVRQASQRCAPGRTDRVAGEFLACVWLRLRRSRRGASLPCRPMPSSRRVVHNIYKSGGAPVTYSAQPSSLGTANSIAAWFCYNDTNFIGGFNCLLAVFQRSINVLGRQPKPIASFVWSVAI